ncbi:unnamed protein product, partial [Porites lobata]
MQRYQKEIIRKHFGRLVEDMEPNPVVRYLFEKGIVSKEDMEVIRSKDTSDEQNDALLLILMRKGPDAFKRLIEALQRNKSSLADILLDEERKELLKKTQDINLNSPSTSHVKSTSASEFGEETGFQGTIASRTDQISMDDKHRNILRRTRLTLRKDLEPIKLLPYLVDVLDHTDEEEIKASSNEKRVSGVDKLLEILPRKGQKAFDIFKKALQKVQPHLVVHLEMEEMKTQLNQEKGQSADEREENQKLKME